MLIGIQDEILRLAQLGFLDSLLKDQTTGHNIRWATDAYSALGRCYAKNAEITSDLITGEHSGVIRNRARKELELQTGRTKSHAEVFTPIWVCNKMIDAALEESHACSPQTEESFIESRWLEITCGEAPFLVQRYDVLTGEIIPIEQRKGILDRKLQGIAHLIDPKHENLNAGEQVRISIGTGKRGGTAVKKWFQCAVRAFQSTYGYELQGDNLLIARLNLYMTFEEYFNAICPRKPTPKESQQIIEIITWNIWQMDGLTNHTPCGDEAPSAQRSLFDWAGLTQKPKEIPKPCQVRFYIDSENYKTFTIPQLAEEGEQVMKFDYIVGNPPYQEEAPGTSTSDKPIYHLFMNETYKLSTKTELVTPGRFLFNAGATPTAWNEKMLKDKHLKVIWYEQDSSKLFPSTDIKGGVVVTYHDNLYEFKEIGVFTSFDELNRILRKTYQKSNMSIKKIIFNQNRFNLKELFQDYPEFRTVIGSDGRDKRFRNNIFEKIKLFSNESEFKSDLKILGIINNNRVYKYFPIKYMDVTHENIYKYKVLVPRANGSGAIGEVLSTPLIGEPLIGYTQSFIGFGSFDTRSEAENCLKYIKSKFVRCMLGILKITQDNPPEKWKYVPLQDFSSNSDIDWTKSIPEIDQQLYKKYGLDKDEIDFIESHVKPMD